MTRGTRTSSMSYTLSLPTPGQSIMMSRSTQRGKSISKEMGIMVEVWIGLVINHKIISRSQLLFKTPPVSETVTFKKRRGYSQARTLDPRAVNMVVMAGPLKVTIQIMRHMLLPITVPNRTMINTIWTASNRINLARKLHISHQLRTTLGRK